MTTLYKHNSGNRENLSDVIERLKTLADGGDLTVSDFLRELNVFGHMFVCFVLSVPFLIPMPLPGVSTPLGIAIAFVAAQIVLGKDPWVPASWGKRVLSGTLIKGILTTVSKVLRVTEKVIAPRLKFFARHPGFVRINGGIIFVLAVLLALPMPPGFNAPPALAIMILSLGSVEKDGVAIIAGYVLTSINALLFGAAVMLGFDGLKALLGLAG